MKAATMGAGRFSAIILGIAIVGLFLIGPPSRHRAALPPRAGEPAPSSVSAGGFTLTSDNIEMPIDEATYPEDPNVAVVNANCTACHSPSMALVQPPMPREKWEEIVVKMRDVYHAPIADGDASKIARYFASRRNGDHGREAEPDLFQHPLSI